MYFLISYAEFLTPTGKKNHPLFLFEYSVFSLKQISELTADGCYYQQTRERKVEISKLFFSDATSVKSFELYLQIESDKLVSRIEF